MFFTLTSFAQRFDGIIFFGISGCQVDGDFHGGYHKIGGNFGLNVTHRITDKLEFQTGLNYIGKGARNASKQAYFKTQLRYVQVPIQLNFDIYKRISISGGLFFGYLINGKTSDYGGTIMEGSEFFRNFEPSAFCSFNYQYFDKLVFNFGISYSILPVRTSTPFFVNWFNNVLTVTATYRLSNAKK